MILPEIDLTTPCIEWLGYINKKGYGQRQYKKRVMLAHRAAYIEIYGEASVAGLVVDHLCRNRKCVNVQHLEPVTGPVNVARGEGPTAVNARKTHCIYGHEFTPENTKDNQGKRKCRECHKRISREWARKNRLRILSLS